MFLKRLLSGAVLVVIIATALYFGGIATGAVMLVFSLIGVFELLRVYDLHDKPLGVVAYIATALFYALLMSDRAAYLIPLCVSFVIAVLSVYVITYPTYSDKNVMSVIFSYFYVAVMLGFVYLIRQMEHGGAYVVMVFICSWVNDTLAYCTGITIGKHKMSPVLSPKKSVEGLVGGLLGATIVGACYGLFVNRWITPVDYAPAVFGVAGLVGAAVAVIGDLCASAIKRNNDIKDYGNLIPGHGGVLDRFDSMIFTAPIIYYCIYYMM